MASNENLVKRTYAKGIEDRRATESRATGLEFHFTKKLLDGYIHSDSHVLEVGCGPGYYGMHYADQCAHYTGIDIVPENIELFRNKIRARGCENVTAEVGDATALQLPDESYDVVLCLGPMYHLPPEECDKVFRECIRVCKPGGILAFAYISPLGVYLMGMLWVPDVYPNETANEWILRQHRDDSRPDLFFFNIPEEMRKKAEAHRLTVLRNSGVNFSFNPNMINAMREDQFTAFMEICEEMVNHESCTGLSQHCLLVGKKVHPL